MGAKQLQLLAEALPQGSRFAIMWEAFARGQVPAIESAGARLRVELKKVSW